MRKYFLTRQEFAKELGIDTKTFRRILLEYDIFLPKGIITPLKAEEIRLKLGLKKDESNQGHEKIN